MTMRERLRAGDDLVDDHTYDLLQALVSSLEALDAYREFAADAGGSVFDHLIEVERAQAAVLLDAVRERLSSMATGATGGHRAGDPPG